MGSKEHSRYIQIHAISRRIQSVLTYSDVISFSRLAFVLFFTLITLSLGWTDLTYEISGNLHIFIHLDMADLFLWLIGSV